MSRYSGIGILATLAGVMAFGPLPGQVVQSMLRLPDTGQTKSYTDTPGEDSDFLIHPPFFLVYSDGTATDTVTGLMWQRVDGGEMTVEAAETYCQQLTLGGYDDWRLPTAQEAFSIMNHGRQNPAVDSAVFQKTTAEYWWTSERQAGNATRVWVTNAGGGIGNHTKTETLSAGGTKRFHVRAVRDQQAPPVLPTRYTLSDSTVLDHLTGLTWKRFATTDSMTWEDALLLAGNEQLAGYGDWRLPNVKELESINEESLSQPSIDPVVFPGIGIRKFWTGTSLSNQPLKAWFMDTHYGVVSYDLKTAKNTVLLVRGGTGGTTDTHTESAQVLHVYPNPFNASMKVEGAEYGSVIQLYDALGRLHWSGADISGQDLSALPPGPYILLISGKTTANLRLIKR